MTPLTEEARITAHHEAGHVWWYWRRGWAVRYVSLRPRRQASGITVPVTCRHISIFDSADNALSGVLAEAMYSWRQDPDGAPWEDAVDCALLVNSDGDTADIERAHEALRMRPEAQWKTYELWWSLIEKDWPAITAAAGHMLASPRATRGRDLFDLFDQHGNRP